MSAPDGLRAVDLTQPLGPETTPWPGTRPLRATTAESFAAGDGCYARDLEFPEHIGTHLDAPAHFDPVGRRVHELTVRQLVRPARVVDVRDVVGDDPDAEIDAAALRDDERRHGAFAAGDAVLVRTGWDRFLAEPAMYLGTPPPRFPGLSVDAAQLLVARGVAGVGIDTLGIDPGRLEDCPAHRVTLPAGLWHLEGLVALGELPATGALLVVGAPVLVDGSGTPARVIALVPDQRAPLAFG